MRTPGRESSSPSRKERRLLALWALLVFAAIAFQLGSRALFEPDEGRNAEVMLFNQGIDLLNHGIASKAV